MNVCFSVLSYYPSFITNESINIGILFHDKDNDIRIFKSTSNWTRVQKFDDELDVEYLKCIIKGIENEVVNDTLFNINEKFNLEKYVKFYVNELKFSPVSYSNVDDLDEFINETKKIFLRYDYAKKDRPNREKQIKYIKNIMCAKKVNFINKSPIGEYNESINYDYIIGDYAFKLFSFENTNAVRKISNIKSWAYNAKEMKDRYKTIFIYDKEQEGPVFESILSILKEEAYKVLPLNDAIPFILSIHDSSKSE